MIMAPVGLGYFAFCVAFGWLVCKAVDALSGKGADHDARVRDEAADRKDQ